VATLWWDNGHSHMLVLAVPALRCALENARHVNISGRLHTDYVEVEEVEDVPR
jgi:hypothetical protein